MRVILAVAMGFVIGCMAGCGGGGGSSGTSSSSSSSQTIASAAPNVAAIVVDCGPSATCNTSPVVNLAYVTVTVCVPGSSTECQTFDHIQVDTQSYGLRLLADATDTSGNPYNLALPVEDQNESGEPLAECAVFADGYSWGPLATADIEVSGEATTSAIPVQVIGSSNYTTPPQECTTASVNNPEDTVASFGANGILGVGPFVQDCGPGCTPGGGASPTYYYLCSPSANCMNTPDTSVDLSQQVSNPVPFFLTDNNGTIVELPSISATGAENVSGALVFGIGTESNNGLGAATVYYAYDGGDGSGDGSIASTFNGQSLTDSFLDSGSNGYFFTDSSIMQCTSATGDVGFYCPVPSVSLSAQIMGEDSTSGNPSGTSTTVDFSVASAQQLFNNNSGNDTAFNNLAGTLGTGFQEASEVFDWGLSFYFGRNVFTAIYNPSTGELPYYAF